jgi:hypothetical protein
MRPTPSLANTLHLGRIRNLWPLLVFLLAVAVADQAILRLDLTRLKPSAQSAEWVMAWQGPFRATAQRFDAARPQALIIGSSRAEAILLPYLEQAARDAGRPHQVANLGISFGTPSLILSGLDELTPYRRQWPTGSHLIYVFSPHEMGGLQPQKLVTTAAGRALLSRHLSAEAIDRLLNEVPLDELRNPWLRRLYPHSGLAQVMVKAQNLLPSWLAALRDLRRLPAINIVKPASLVATPECRTAFSLHPANVEAFNTLATRFGQSLTVVFPPRHPVSRQCTVEADRDAAHYVAQVLAHTGGTLIADPDTVMPLPVDDFLIDTEHVVTDHGRRVVAAALMRMVP